jgi:hypothetical protein
VAHSETSNSISWLIVAPLICCWLAFGSNIRASEAEGGQSDSISSQIGVDAHLFIGRHARRQRHPAHASISRACAPLLHTVGAIIMPYFTSVMPAASTSAAAHAHQHPCMASLQLERTWSAGLGLSKRSPLSTYTVWIQSPRLRQPAKVVSSFSCSGVRHLPPKSAIWRARSRAQARLELALVLDSALTVSSGSKHKQLQLAA